MARIDGKTVVLRSICEQLEAISEELLDLYDQINDVWLCAADELPRKVKVPLPLGYDQALVKAAE